MAHRPAFYLRMLRATASELLAAQVRARAVQCLLLITVGVFIAVRIGCASVGSAPIDLPLYALLRLRPLATIGWQWWRLLTANFTHYELWHIAGNMLALLVFGPPVERTVGAFRFLGLYLVSGIVALSVACLRGDGGVGASGAVAGVLGVLVVLAWLRRNQSEAAFGLAALALVGSASFLASGPILTIMAGIAVNNEAHAAGLLFGIALGVLFARRTLHRSDSGSQDSTSGFGGR